MIKMETSGKEFWRSLDIKNRDFSFSKTKFVSDKLKIDVRVLNLFNKKMEDINQLPDVGLIVLNKTILNSHDKVSISEQGFISNDFFKAKVIDIDTIKGVSFHLVKVISGIITIDSEHKVELIADENFNRKLNSNKLAAKLVLLFLEHVLNVEKEIIDNININVDEKNFKLKFNFGLNIEKELIFQVRDLVNEFLANNKITYKNYSFFKNVVTKSEKEIISSLELIEIRNFEVKNNNFYINFLVGKEKIDNFLLSKKKELLSAIKVINQTILLINNQENIEYFSELAVDSYESLEQLKTYYLQIKQKLDDYKKKNPVLINKIINETVETQYSEKIGEYEFIHVNLSNILIDRKVLELKALEKLNDLDDKLLFLTNDNYDNSMINFKISKNLANKINIDLLIDKFGNENFEEINYDNYNAFIIANDYQSINTFVSDVINFFKVSEQDN